MAQMVQQFYYVDQGKPILKTEYDDGSEDFYDASGQFQGASWSHLADGTVIDPYQEAMAQEEANRQAQMPQFQFGGRTDQTSITNPQTGQRFGTIDPRTAGTSGSNTQGYAAPASVASGGGNQMPLPNQQRRQEVTPGYQQPGVAQTNTPAQPQAPPAAQSPSQPPVDPRQAADMSRYDYAANPRQALLNAMADIGGYQLTNNPYVDRLLQAAPALATSFMGQRGLAGGGDLAGSYGAFGQFLRQALQSGSIFGTLSQAQGMFPQLINQVRAYNQAGSSGGNPTAPILQNDYIRQLAAMFGANDNQGALGMYGQLFSPFMTGAMQRPFSDMMEARYAQGARNFYQGGDQRTPGYGGNDWWKYLFGQ